MNNVRRGTGIIIILQGEDDIYWNNDKAYRIYLYFIHLHVGLKHFNIHLHIGVYHELTLSHTYNVFLCMYM